jgi:hypothetical protein
MATKKKTSRESGSTRRPPSPKRKKQARTPTPKRKAAIPVREAVDLEQERETEPTEQPAATTRRGFDEESRRLSRRDQEIEPEE